MMSRWDRHAPAAWNKHLAALRSFAAYALRQEFHADPARHLERRKTTGRADKAIPAARLEKFPSGWSLAARPCRAADGVAVPARVRWGRGCASRW
jgi:hypothetical protein